jgi:hypothetical protein
MDELWSGSRRGVRSGACLLFLFFSMQMVDDIARYCSDV